MDKTRYTDLGIFENKEKAMKFRNENYKWCSCYTEDASGYLDKEKSKIRLWVKLPNISEEEYKHRVDAAKTEFALVETLNGNYILKPMNKVKDSDSIEQEFYGTKEEVKKESRKHIKELKR